MGDYFFPLLYPKDSESLRIMDIRLREVGAKRPLNGTSTSEQTDRQTDRQTHMWTNWLIESIGPEGRCFENKDFGIWVRGCVQYEMLVQLFCHISVWVLGSSLNLWRDKSFTSEVYCINVRDRKQSNHCKANSVKYALSKQRNALLWIPLPQPLHS